MLHASAGCIFPDVHINDWLSVIAVLASPLVALQVSTFLARRQTAADRRRDVFRTLMATRAMRFSPQHVEALNAIDIEFAPAKFKAVRTAWKVYLDHLSNGPGENPEAEPLRRWGRQADRPTSGTSRQDVRSTRIRLRRNLRQTCRILTYGPRTSPDGSRRNPT